MTVDTTTSPTQVRCYRRPGSRWSACPCTKCLTRSARMRKAYNAGLAEVIAPRADVTAAWALLDKAVAAGWSPQVLSSATGVPRRTLETLLAHDAAGKPRDRLHDRTVRALLRPWKTPTAGRIYGIGAVRRLQALAVIGYGVTTISHATGIKHSTLATIRSKGADLRVRMDPALVRTITDFYEAHQYRSGTDARAKTQAARAGWVHPDHWSESHIDDPSAQPFDPLAFGLRLAPDLEEDGDDDGLVESVVDDVAVEQVLAGDDDSKHSRAHALTDAERVLVVRRGTEQGMSAQTLAALLDVAERSVSRIRTRHGIHPAAWAEQLAS